MSAHNFHPHCGYASCCEVEEADERDERDDELRATYLNSLTACPDFIAAVPLNPEECIAVARAVSVGDMADLGRLFLAAIEREASEHIAVKAEECGITPGEAAQRLYSIYRPVPMRAAA